jgi:protein-S-isoprenylcysteine O-methyltransferase Ste14
LATCLVLVLIYARWEPMPEAVWSLRNPAARAALNGLFWLGWTLVIVASFLSGHWDLTGLKQALSRRYEPPEFRTPGPYRWVRHPMMLGLLAAFWSTPEMSRGHLLFAAANTIYVLAAIRWEERDLTDLYGAEYTEYQRQIPRICPFRIR